MGLKITQVDAFTDKPFSGNPAAVCILTEPQDETWMQNVANEMNLSETAFLYKTEDGFNLRWFTPALEVDLCGHATLASAHVLWEDGHIEREAEARFHTLSGLLTAKFKEGLIEMNFPSEPPESLTAPAELMDGLGIKHPKYTGKNRLDYLVEVDSEKTLRNLYPDFTSLRKIGGRGFIVTSLADSDEFDFISRYFAPSYGIDEDPVTGSAHCCLGPYWEKRLNKNNFKAYQASARGGVVNVRTEGERVFLSGNAVTIFRGELV